MKPDNVLLDWRGHLKLTDLGLCKKIDSPEVKGLIHDPDESSILRNLIQKAATNMTNMSTVISRSTSSISHTSSNTASHTNNNNNTNTNTNISPPSTATHSRPSSRDKKNSRPLLENEKESIPTHRERALAYSTVGTPDYIAPEVLTKKVIIICLYDNCQYMNEFIYKLSAVYRG